jgi:hypothetical protein
MKVYSGNRVSFNFAGILVESGKGGDVFCEIEQDEESFTWKAGIDGEVTRSENKNKLTTVTLTLQQTSAANDLLSAAHALDLKVAGGAGVAPLMVRDQDGRSVCIDAEASIMKWPTQTFGRESGERVWQFKLPNPEMFVGGR